MILHKPPIKLRGHHLICLHFFTGEGYNPEFVENLKEILVRVKSGEEIEVCSGADEVCMMCPFLKDRRCRYDKHAENEIQKMDRDATALLKIEPSTKVTWIEIQERLQDIFKRWSADYCRSCTWKTVCEKTAHYQAINEIY
jgi:hypothetical protein